MELDGRKNFEEILSILEILPVSKLEEENNPVLKKFERTPVEFSNLNN